jgi:protein-disulfide isomerase/uncharacterized membrane protein
MTKRHVVFLVVCALGFSALLWSAADFFSLMSGDRIGGSFCSINAYWNCDRASLSPLGSWWGIPIGLAGAAWFFTVAVVSLFSDRRAFVFLRILFAIAILKSLILFGYLLHLKTGCVICFFSYACIIATTCLGWRRFPAGRLSNTAGGFWLAMGLIGLTLYGAVEMNRSAVKISDEEVRHWLDMREEVPLVSKLQKGNPDGKIQIAEFSDFGCPHCAAAAETLLPFLAQQPDVHIYYYPFPLDSSCNPAIDRMIHPHSCDWAKGAVCAEAQGVLWKYHDEAFQIAKDAGELPDLLSVIDQMQIPNVDEFKACLTTGATEQELRKMIETGVNLKIGSTPSFFINGRRIEGYIPMPLLKRILRELRKHD